MGKATILIVDDEPGNLSLLTHLLRPLDQVHAANSGENALRAATSEPRQYCRLVASRAGTQLVPSESRHAQNG